jgi:hypothetical protein
MTRSSRTTARRMMMPALMMSPRVQVPPMAMMEVRSLKTWASLLTTPVSSQVPPP